MKSDDQVNRCSYCASPVLGPSQSRDCVNHSGILAKGVCNVCGDLICEKCMEKRTGNYGGKLFTITNCTKRSCKQESSWARLLNPEYRKLTNMDWSDNIDNGILRVSGFGAVMIMVFELIFILSMLYIQYFTIWGIDNIPFWFFRGDMVILLCIIGNFVSALLLQTALQVYVHERQLGAGIMLLLFLIIEIVLLIYRGIQFNLLNIPNIVFTAVLLGGFIFASLLIFVGAILAIRTGNRKNQQLKYARETLGLNK